MTLLVNSENAVIWLFHILWKQTALAPGPCVPKSTEVCVTFTIAPLQKKIENRQSLAIDNSTRKPEKLPN